MMKKYKVWMIQEGNDELIQIICVSCGKVMPESADFWCDVDKDNVEMFCKKSCINNVNEEFYQIQKWRFAIEACKSMGFIKEA